MCVFAFLRLLLPPNGHNSAASKRKHEAELNVNTMYGWMDDGGWVMDLMSSEESWGKNPPKNMNVIM